MKFTTDIDLNALQRKLNATAKEFGDTQEQSTYRWGVFTAQDIAFRTQAYGRSSKPQKGAIVKDASNVLFSHEGAAKGKGKSLTAKFQGKEQNLSRTRYLETVEQVIAWIDQNRTLAYKRTKKLAPENKKVCSDKVFKAAINKKMKESGGMAKDSWIDAGEDIARKQKGSNQSKIGASFLKWTRKPMKLGTSKSRMRNGKNESELVSLVEYTKASHVVKKTDMKTAVIVGAQKMIKFYKSVIAYNAKKTKR